MFIISSYKGVRSSGSNSIKDFIGARKLLGSGGDSIIFIRAIIKYSGLIKIFF